MTIWTYATLIAAAEQVKHLSVVKTDSDILPVEALDVMSICPTASIDWYS